MPRSPGKLERLRLREGVGKTGWRQYWFVPREDLAVLSRRCSNLVELGGSTIKEHGQK